MGQNSKAANLTKQQRKDWQRFDVAFRRSLHEATPSSMTSIWSELGFEGLWRTGIMGHSKVVGPRMLFPCNGTRFGCM